MDLLGNLVDALCDTGYRPTLATATDFSKLQEGMPKEVFCQTLTWTQTWTQMMMTHPK